MAFPDRPKVTPLAPQRFALQITLGQSARDKLRYLQELLSNQVPSGDIAEVLERSFDALIREIEKRKFAATEKPRSPSRRRSTKSKRHIPAHVKRAVLERDGGCCTFVSGSGRRCSERKFLEFDHVDEVARGGQATVAGIRLRCRAHNQFTAECTFGAGFMNEKRQEALRASAETRAANGRAASPAHAQAAP